MIQVSAIYYPHVVGNNGFASIMTTHADIESNHFGGTILNRWLTTPVIRKQAIDYQRASWFSSQARCVS